MTTKYFVNDAEIIENAMKRMETRRPIHRLSTFSAFYYFVVIFTLVIGTFLVAFMHCQSPMSSEISNTATVTALPVLSGAHQLARREDCNETTRYAADAASQTVPAGVGIPISTQTETETSTLYSIRSTPETITLTSIKTKTTTAIESVLDTCSAWTFTETVSVTVSAGYSEGDITITGVPATVTNMSKDLSYTSSLPDATVSGKPATITNVQDETSYTGLPDATVSGNPLTQTDLATHYSPTGGLPDATIPGAPSTVTPLTTVLISDLWSTSLASTLSSETTDASTPLTTITTVNSVLRTVTVTNQNPLPAYGTETYSSTTWSEAVDGVSTSVSACCTVISYITKTGGEPVTSFTTVHIPYSAANATEMSVTSAAMPTTTEALVSPVIVVGDAGSLIMTSALSGVKLACTLLAAFISLV